tara:strand:+ start:178 stop:621 length:444 start_codon:yes stop_codon:yes gene_type:complete
MNILRILIISFLLLYFNVSKTEENYFLSLKYNKVNVRYGPGLDYPIKFIFEKKNYPVQIIDEKENFRKILDYRNNGGWVHRSQLKKNNSVIVLEEKIIFNKSTKYSEPIAVVKNGRLLIVKKKGKKWLKVVTGNYTGWVNKEYLWGN